MRWPQVSVSRKTADSFRSEQLSAWETRCRCLLASELCQAAPFEFLLLGPWQRRVAGCEPPAGGEAASHMRPACACEHEGSMRASMWRMGSVHARVCEYMGSMHASVCVCVSMWALCVLNAGSLCASVQVCEHVDSVCEARVHMCVSTYARVYACVCAHGQPSLVLTQSQRIGEVARRQGQPFSLPRGGFSCSSWGNQGGQAVIRRLGQPCGRAKGPPSFSPHEQSRPPGQRDRAGPPGIITTGSPGSAAL